MFRLSTLIPEGSQPRTENETDAELGIRGAFSCVRVLRVGVWKRDVDDGVGVVLVGRVAEGVGDGWGCGVGGCEGCCGWFDGPGDDDDGARWSGFVVDVAAAEEADLEDFLTFFFFFFRFVVVAGSWYEVDGS